MTTPNQRDQHDSILQRDAYVADNMTSMMTLPTDHATAIVQHDDADQL
jgi:hypothetical protein